MVQIVDTIDVDLPHYALPAGDWADAYRVTLRKRYANARAASIEAFGTFPAWVNALMALRNLVVAPLGLKTGKKMREPIARIGFFPLLSETETQVVVGMDDRHLDFRCVIDIADNKGGQTLTISTIINRHNWLGRVYLTIILPFHRLILRTVLARMARNN